MFGNKLLNYSIIIIISITILGVAAFFLYQYIFPSSDALEKNVEPTIDEILPLTVNVPKLNTNLGDDSIIVIELTLQADNEDAKEEADKRMYQIKDRINLLLKNLKKENFATEAKILEFKTELKSKINSILQEGKIEDVDITQLFLQ